MRIKKACRPKRQDLMLRGGNASVTLARNSSDFLPQLSRCRHYLLIIPLFPPLIIVSFRLIKGGFPSRAVTLSRQTTLSSVCGISTSKPIKVWAKTISFSLKIRDSAAFDGVSRCFVKWMNVIIVEKP